MATLSIKVVPGSKRDRVVGRYGDAIKVQVSAPPEGGKANRAVVELLAGALGVRPNQVQVVKGHSQSRKVVRVDGIEQADADARLGVVVQAFQPAPPDTKPDGKQAGKPAPQG